MYFFQGGDGLQHVATNNPLYITDNPDGGHGLKTDYEKEWETIYAGVYVINSSINKWFSALFCYPFPTRILLLLWNPLRTKDCVRLSVEAHF